MPLIRRLKEQKDFTERECDIARYILEHPECVETMSSRELGHKTFTSAASVTRFCQKLGVKGFPEFKIKFISELHDGLLVEEQEKITISERENVVTMAKKIKRIQEQAIEQTQNELSYSQLVRVSRFIAEAVSVDFYAYDTNIHLAQYGCALFFHAGKRAAVYSATNIQGLHAVMPADGHVAVILSHTGKNEKLAQIEKALHENGTKVIAITPDRNGVIGRYADEVFLVSAPEKVEEFWAAMFFESGKYILDVLYGLEFSRNYQNNLRLNEKYEKIGRKYFWGLEDDV